MPPPPLAAAAAVDDIIIIRSTTPNNPWVYQIFAALSPHMHDVRATFSVGGATCLLPLAQDAAGTTHSLIINENYHSIIPYDQLATDRLTLGPLIPKVLGCAQLRSKLPAHKKRHCRRQQVYLSNSP